LTEKQATAILKQYGLKKTAGRLALLSILLKANKPLSHKDICMALNDLYYDSVSVYRSLESFIEAGFVHRVEDESRTWLFALCTCGESGHCHPHFFCRSCGRCECLKNYRIPLISDLNDNYVVEEQRYYIRGICRDCLANQQHS
jgi:Fur family transcriptional regulator, ferric uptake regulator